MGDQDQALTAGQLFEELETPLVEQASRVVIPKKGKLFAEDGSMRVAIIRPCVSRGKRIRNLPPIYEAAMLREHANVFAGWPMYMDHLMEQAVEEMEEELRAIDPGLLEHLQEKARSIKELGGRVVKSYFDDSVTFEDDEERGYQKGAVVGEVIPQPGPRKMLEADPGILHVSINAWPSGARPGNASWDQSVRGMIIEGIRRKPMGSVDWVFRGGAGGRPIPLEEREVAASLLEAVYSAATSTGSERDDPDDTMKKLSELKPDELREYLQENASHLVSALPDPKDPDGDGDGDGGGDSVAITEAQVKNLIESSNADLLEQIETKLTESAETSKEEVDKLVEERDEHRARQAKAFELLEEAGRNGLPDVWVNDLKRNYTLHPSGPADGLQLQEQEDDDGNVIEMEQVLENQVKADVEHAVKLIRESGGKAEVTGLGASAEDEGGEGGKTRKPQNTAFRDAMKEMDLLPEKPEEQEEKLAEMIGGGS